MARRWLTPSLLAISGAAIAARQISTGSLLAGAVLGLLFGLLAFILSPLAFPRSIAAAEAQRRAAEDGKPIVYWRTGCPFCLRLRARLGPAGARRAHWVDIWRDPDGAAAVRAVTGGDETVPTVVIGDQSHVNPDPSWLRRQLA